MNASNKKVDPDGHPNRPDDSPREEQIAQSMAQRGESVKRVMLTAEVAAEIIGVERNYIYILAARGKLAAERRGRLVFVREGDVLAYARSERRRGIPARATCMRGHPMDGDNVRTSSSGGRECKACARIRSAEHRARKRVAA